MDTKEAVELLKKLIACPSFSKEEEQTALILCQFFTEKNIPFQKEGNNILVKNKYFNPLLPTILLNSHHDTVKPSTSWSLDPFCPLEKDQKLFGLGSNDAGGALVSLIATFCHFYSEKKLPYNLLLVASAEEEISGKNGIYLLVTKNLLPNIAFAIVGEPTLMHLAIAEKGLIVMDCTIKGQAGHAARDEGDNAIYKAIKAINWIQNYQFSKVSPLLGSVKMSVTSINAGKQHNVIPDQCNFVIDCRVTEQYSLSEVLTTIQANVEGEIIPRSMRLHPSSIPESHPIVQKGIALGRQTYGSPTTSDQALLPYPSLKIGPGHSERSHTADEFIYLSEIEEAIKIYTELLTDLKT